MVRARGVALGVAMLATAVLVAPSSAAQVIGIDWTSLLPALPSPTQTEPNDVPHCHRANLNCVRTEVKRMRAAQAELGCDHRGVFATTYLELTKAARDAMIANPQLLRWKKWFFREDALFADVYFRTLRRWNQGLPVPDAWRIAFEAAATGEVTGAQDMLLGINAHVQNDMPFVLAELGLRDRNGEARKPDHDLFNKVLAGAYETVVSQVGARYDSTMSITNPPGVPVDDVAGLEIVRQWREQVWRNAERLVNAQSEEERNRIAGEIQAYAAQWANSIALVQVPGLRASRDAYCAQQFGR
jgi:signal transduction histidine kinase